MVFGDYRKFFDAFFLVFGFFLMIFAEVNNPGRDIGFAFASVFGSFEAKLLLAIGSSLSSSFHQTRKFRRGHHERFAITSR